MPHGVFILLLLFGCSYQQPTTPRLKVALSKINGKYTLFRFGKPFFVKGASGFTNLGQLSAAGGNTIRVWDTVNFDSIVKKANQYHLAIIVGFTMPDSRYADSYDDTLKINRQFIAYKKFVNKYKNDPSILMWCVGNELVFPFNPSYNKFYKAFNQIVDMIHRDDPDHPVTTTMVNFQPRNIFLINTRTHIDLISFNLFGRLNYLKSELKQYWWLWRGPYLITEWGIDGPWEGTAQTAWGAYIEPNSTDKAVQYHARYANQMPVDDPRFLGSCMFYWGQKQEYTPTWFSLFDEYGNRTGAVAAAQHLWTGKWPAEHAPQIGPMQVNGKKGIDNIIISGNSRAGAKVLILKPAGNIAKVEWQIFKEDWYKENNMSSTRKLIPVVGLFTKTDGLNAEFLAPSKKGPYRIYCKIYSNNGTIANCNTPFYVIDSK